MHTLTDTRTVSAHVTRPMLNAGEVDLRGFKPVVDGFAIHALKRDAIRAARAAGLPASEVAPAFNRFCRCWLVGRALDAHTFRALGADGFVHLRFA
jgi:hypothetical protein